MSTPLDPDLSKLAAQSGLIEHWQDVQGRSHQVQPAVLRALLEALGLPCSSLSQTRESQRWLEQESDDNQDALILSDVGRALEFNHRGALAYQVTLEQGGQVSGTAVETGSARVGIPALNTPGYHMLEIGGVRRPLVLAPLRCPSVSQLTGLDKPRLWGVAAQVYGLRRSQPGLIGEAFTSLTDAGDYTALAQFAQAAGHAGADALAISPVHAMFSADPARYSPYAPSSRLFLNVGYVDPASMLGVDTPLNAASPEQASLIDWPKVLHARLEQLFRVFEQFEAGGPERLVRAFEAFRERGGAALEDHGRYEALHAYFAPALGASSGWQQWPAELHDPRGSAVHSTAQRLAREVSFHIFLQWLADEGLGRAQDSAIQAGMALGLISDLAIGTDARGSHAWSHQGELLDQVSVGAAPDLYQPGGQNWGLTAFSPRALRDKAFTPFIETLRAALAHAGGVRIDHILGLARMWLIPQGADAMDGVYLRYPFEDMLRILALEASRHRAMVIGENLGTVPTGFNERLYDKRIYGISVLWFERQAFGSDEPGAFTPPQSWTPHAVATSTTHDLPTIMGWWSGRDLWWRRREGQIADDELARLNSDRTHDKDALAQALTEAGWGGHIDLPSVSPQVLRDAVLSFVASAPCPLVLVPAEDLLAESEQPNLPGAWCSGPLCHPNWQRRQSKAAQPIFEETVVREGVAAITHARERS